MLVTIHGTFNALVKVLSLLGQGEFFCVYCVIFPYRDIAHVPLPFF